MVEIMRRAEDPVLRERFDGLLAEFQDFITTQELSPATLRLAWELYGQADLADLKMRYPGAGITRIRQFDRRVMKRVLKGERDIYGMDLALYHLVFRLATFAPMDREPAGRFLKGIPAELLDRARTFCMVMDGVGWKAGDLQKKYPE